jgi:hypothetical protein
VGAYGKGENDIITQDLKKDVLMSEEKGKMEGKWNYER